jgi:hypothetical protein
MAMMHKRDEPAYYHVVDSHGTIVVYRVAKSKVFAAKRDAERRVGEKLKIILAANRRAINV